MGKHNRDDELRVTRYLGKGSKEKYKGIYAMIKREMGIAEWLRISLKLYRYYNHMYYPAGNPYREKPTVKRHRMKNKDESIY